MKIIDLSAEHEPFYFKCLVDDPNWLADAGDYKRAWYETMKPRGLKVKLALTGADEPVGMIQCLPVEESIVTGRDLSFLYCIWVVNNERHRVNHQHKGFGSALLAAFEEDARRSGKKGVVAWGLDIPDFMQADWFTKHGYEEADRQGVQVLLWKAWDAGAQKPAWIRPKKKPEYAPGETKVTCFCYGWCPEINKAFTRAKQAAKATKAVFEEINTAERKTFTEWGISDALFIGGQEVPLGPAPSSEQIKRAIEKSRGKEK
jgi:GNAT superfamily N-acetyltransferase